MMSFLVLNGHPHSPAAPQIDVPWWSFTKTVLAATALTLVRDGRVGLDDPVPEGPFTLRQLLRHEAGLADYHELAAYRSAVAQHDAAWPADDMLRRLDAQALHDAPGSAWHYSNVGYLYVTRLIERTTGLTLAQALHQRAFAPLGMASVRLARQRADLQGVAMGSASDYDPAWVYHGLLVGPLEQAATWLDRLLTGHLLPQTLVHAMQTVHHLGGPIPGRPWTAPAYGLGLMHGPVDGGLILSGHTGSGPGTVVAVYHARHGAASATCAVFAEGEDQGLVEAQAVKKLQHALEIEPIPTPPIKNLGNEIDSH